MRRRTTLEHAVKTERKKWEFEAGESPAMATRILTRLHALLEENGVQWPTHEVLWVAGTIAISSEGTIHDISEHISELDWH